MFGVIVTFSLTPRRAPLGRLASGPALGQLCGSDLSASTYSSTGSTTTTSSTSGLMSMVLPSDELVSSSCRAKLSALNELSSKARNRFNTFGHKRRNQ
ncbi:hypothetical protein EYF80_006811 [Liparis tanakae]|uniref:Uncharacterized protein n=1 Tax=Liparis tanakae TaxID=230148 RepID=A0A4Z2IZ77_9TELE|nr:hypothetical protein EYF80_006811 [Liparis tanakae]